jgi:hypothetical protein
LGVTGVRVDTRDGLQRERTELVRRPAPADVLWDVGQFEEIAPGGTPAQALVT